MMRFFIHVIQNLPFHELRIDIRSDALRILIAEVFVLIPE